MNLAARLAALERRAGRVESHSSGALSPEEVARRVATFDFAAFDALVEQHFARLSPEAREREITEPKWLHAKRAIVEPTRLLTASELADRVCEHFGCHHDDQLAMPEQVA